MSTFRNQRGFTLLEIMFALGILIVGVYLISEGVNQMETASRDTRLLSSTDRTINNIVDNIRTGLGGYQITFDMSQAVKDEMLDVKNLPMAWGPGTIVAVKDCASAKLCPNGRYGFVVRPLPSYRGLYVVTLRMTNTEWKDQYREYEFLATVQ